MKKLIDNLLSRPKRDSVTETPEPVEPTPDKPAIRDIAEAIENGEAFDYAERGEFEGAIYESRTGDNRWTPRHHPAVWMLISYK